MQGPAATVLPLPTVEEEKEAFHKIVNIEDYPEFRERARELASAYLANADFGACDLYAPFQYTAEAFDSRLNEIYHGVLPGMYQDHSYDCEVITWENGKRYRVGRASDRVVRDRLLQLAPFNLLDGVWLQNVPQARPSSDVESRLFSIWSDEVGNGKPERNHANVYRTLLHSQGINLPAVTSKEFLDIDVAPGAWRGPVFQLCTGLFPQELFPELLGMTLYLEWESSPTLMPIVRMLRRRGIDPLFYSLHVAIDNISVGHGALAKEAVEIYLEDKREEGGDTAVQNSWERIWRGYVTWATSGFGGEGFPLRRLLLDKISINVGTRENPQLLPDFRKFYADRMRDLIRRKAPYASEVHGTAALGGVRLNELFEDPDALMKQLLDAGYFDLHSPRDSRFFELLDFEGPMFKVFTDEEVDTVLDWLESLARDEVRYVDPLEQPAAAPALSCQVVQMIEKLSTRAKTAHDRLTLPDHEARARPLVELFDDPAALLEGLLRAGWIVPSAPDRSMFLTRIVSNGGPMEGVLSDAELDLLNRWIEGGAELPGHRGSSESARLEASSASAQADATPTFLDRRPFIGQGAVH